MVGYIVGWLLLVGFASVAFAMPAGARRVFRIGLPLMGLILLGGEANVEPGYRLLASSLFMLLIFKGASATGDAKHPMGFAWLLAMLVWPGFDHENFAARSDPPKEVADRFRSGLFWFYFGVVLLLGTALALPKLGNAGPWLGIAAVLALIHFGVSNLLTSVVWLAGFPVKALFNDPFRSRSLREFWTVRWNIPFVEMDRRLFLRPLARVVGLRYAVFGIFLISGLLHEMAISYPAGGGYGGPLLYFVIQGLLVLAEKRWNFSGRVWTLAWVLIPMPILFHTQFRENLIRPFLFWLHELLTSQTVSWWFDKALWVVGGLQLCVLLASFQVPTRLRWNEELPRLGPFNRKLMWTYAATIVFTVVSFAVMTFVLHTEMLRGDRAALVVASFIALFWIMRLLADAFYYRSEDWPEGPQFQIGHLLLNSLFVSLVIGYGGLVVWHLLPPNQ